MFLSDRRVAARYDTSRATVWRWVELGLLPAPFKLGPGTTRWRLADLEAFEAERAGERGGAAQ